MDANNKGLCLEGFPSKQRPKEVRVKRRAPYDGFPVYISLSPPSNIHAPKFTCPLLVLVVEEFQVDAPPTNIEAHQLD